MTNLNLQTEEIKECLSLLSSAQRAVARSLLSTLSTVPVNDVQRRSQLVAKIYHLFGLVTDDELEITQLSLSRDEVILRGVRLGYIDEAEAEFLVTDDEVEGQDESVEDRVDSAAAGRNLLTRAQGYID